MAATYTPIATTTLGTAATSYTFSSIPSIYTDLILVASGSNSTTNSIAVQFNGDTGSTYSDTMLQGDGSSASSQRDSNITYGFVGGTSNDINTTIIQIMNYSNGTTYKTYLSRAGWGGYTLLRAIVGLWRNTSTINSIKVFTVNGQNFNVGYTFTLYGIKAA